MVKIESSLCDEVISLGRPVVKDRARQLEEEVSGPMAEIHQNLRGAARADGHPSGDHRFKMLDATMKRQRFQADALIEVLHAAQELFGYLQDDILLYVAQGLKLPPSRVYGVATF